MLYKLLNCCIVKLLYFAFMRFEVITIFPELFAPFTKESLMGKAVEKGLLSFGIHNLRDFATDKHKTVDDTPYGGGAGMIMKVEPIDKALDCIKAQMPKSKFQTNAKIQISTDKTRTIVLSARGEMFTQRKAEEYANLDQLVLICGRYEGIDQRVADYLADEEISIGPYVLNGGEVAAMAVMEAVGRLLPGVIGNEESLREESYAINDKIQNPNDKSSLKSKIQTTEYPQYTKPAEYKGWKVPAVLMSGNHEEIRKWRRQTGLR
jgi:tRNA (guanine37-N1)-methyltransferase